MQSGFLASLADRHRADGSRRPLLKGLLDRIDGSNLIHALSSGCRPVQHLVWQRLVNLPEDKLTSFVLQCLQVDQDQFPQVTESILTAVAHPALPLSDQILARIEWLIESPRPGIRTAAAKVLALRQPDSIGKLLDRYDDLDTGVLRQFCLADDPSLVVPLMIAFQFPGRSPPPTIGFLVTPEWLAEHHADEPQFVEWLIRQCGYCDDDVTPAVLNLLSSGFSYVTTHMTSEPRMTKIAHRWQRRSRAFVWRLLPDELDLERDDAKPFDPNDPLEVDLFITAVRDSDRLSFREQLQRPPFDRHQTSGESAPVCFHATSQYIRRLILERPLAWAVEEGIPESDRGDFLLEHARVILETNEETRRAADLALRGRWQSRTISVVGSNWSRERSTDRDTRLQSIVLGADHKALPPINERLSPGANSVVAIAMMCGLGHPRLSDWLVDCEQRWSQRLVPIGMEVQVPQVDPSRYAGWKAALPWLGIPSPARPEFGGTVEAAFQPARSFHALAIGPLLLQRMGLCTEPQDMALHISVQTELDDVARTIAFPQLFIHPSSRHRNRPGRLMSRVMSKGFVCAHDDAQIIAPEHTSSTRTELRMFRIYADIAADASSGHSIQRPQLSRSYISDLIGTQVLASAAIGNCAQCRALFADYVSAVDNETAGLPVEFQQLLAANYFESTGEPRDETLLNLLPIFRKWLAVRTVVRENDLRQKLDLRFRSVRDRHVKQILTHWQQQHELAMPEITFADEIDISFPV